MIMIEKAPGSQKGSQAAAEKGGEEKGVGGGGRKKVGASKIDNGIDGAKSEIKAEKRRCHG